MVRILSASVGLLLIALAAAPTASADHFQGPCDNVYWYPESPPGWNLVCAAEDASDIVTHAALEAVDRLYDEVGPTVDCLRGYDPVFDPPAYLFGCA